MAKSASVSSSKNVTFKHLEVALVIKANKNHFHKNNRAFVFIVLFKIMRA